MVDSETLVSLGMSGYLLPGWTVILFVTLSSIFVLMRRIPLYLLTTFLFTVYWGFILYWGEHLSGISSYMTLRAFAVYIFSGLAITSLAIIACFRGGIYHSFMSKRGI
jgi:hypothetical protein